MRTLGQQETKGGKKEAQNLPTVLLLNECQRTLNFKYKLEEKWTL